MDSLTVQREAELLAATRRGGAERERAFREIVGALRPPLGALCLHLCGGRADAEDALQDALLGLYQALPDFRGEARVSTFAHRIALRTALRHRALRPARHAELKEAESVVSPGAPVDEHAASRELARRMADGLAKLPAADRTVLALFGVEGLSHKEIAEILNLPEGTVWYRLHRARKALKALVEASSGAKP